MKIGYQTNQMKEIILRSIKGSVNKGKDQSNKEVQNGKNYCKRKNIEKEI